MNYTTAKAPNEKFEACETLLKKKKVIVIAGPTAAGKTDLSIELCKLINGQVISADSMQVYRGLDIGTAKATIDQQKKITHHLIDIRDIDEPYNVAAYVRDAGEVISHMLSEDTVPVVVGGNGFYIHSLLYGGPLGPSPDPVVRASLEDDLQKFGVELMFDKLRQLDPEYANTITVQDKHKIIRALEIIQVSNKKVSDYPKSNYDINKAPYEFLCYFIYYPKPLIYHRIEQRCDLMLEDGLLHETIQMINKGLLNNSSAKNAIGYRQVLDYLETNKDDAAYRHFVSEFKKASRHYAKRQFTWFRREPAFRWVDMSQITQQQLISDIITDFMS